MKMYVTFVLKIQNMIKMEIEQKCTYLPIWKMSNVIKLKRILSVHMLPFKTRKFDELGNIIEAIPFENSKCAKWTKIEKCIHPEIVIFKMGKNGKIRKNYISLHFKSVKCHKVVQIIKNI